MKKYRHVMRHRNRAAKRQGNLCCYCKREMLQPTQKSPLRRTAEHLRRKADGGKDTKENIVAACFECNSERGEMNWLEFATMKQDAWI